MILRLIYDPGLASKQPDPDHDIYVNCALPRDLKETQYLISGRLPKNTCARDMACVTAQRIPYCKIDVRYQRHHRPEFSDISGTFIETPALNENDRRTIEKNRLKMSRRAYVLLIYG